MSNFNQNTEYIDIHINIFFKNKIMRSRIIITILLTTICSCLNIHKLSSEKDIKENIKQFYKEYCKIWEEANLASSNQLDIKIDSLISQYCTNELKVKSLRWLKDGHDLLTNDWGIKHNSLNKLIVDKNNNQENSYIISYLVESFPVSPSTPVIQKVTLIITVVSDNDRIMIDGVKDISNP